MERSVVNRGFLFGALAFGLVYLLEAEWSKHQGDIVQYDSMRAMSDDPPFLQEQITRVKGLIGWLLAEQSPAINGVTRSIMQSMREDLVRYAKLEIM
jgi:hypothetical protein